MAVQRAKFLGKIAVIGSGGSGKTFLTCSIVNELNEKVLYPWVEEQQVAGTIVVTPYSVELKLGDDASDKVKVILNDNPGQESLSVIRKVIAEHGEEAKGILLIVDSLAWNFLPIGYLQIEELLQNISSEKVPISVIITKQDIQNLFHNTNLLQALTQVMASAIDQITHDMIIKYTNRVYKKEQFFIMRDETAKRYNSSLTENHIPLTVMEQILVNAIEDWNSVNNISGLTIMNIRLFVRSLLLGYCEYIKDHNPEIVQERPEFSALSEDLVNKLNYYRPTAYETEMRWEKLTKGIQNTSSHQEPPIFLNLFQFSDILTYLKEFVLINDQKIQDLLTTIKNHPRLDLMDFTVTDSVTKQGIKKSINLLTKLVEKIHSIETVKEKDLPKYSVESLDLSEF